MTSLMEQSAFIDLMDETIIIGDYVVRNVHVDGSFSDSMITF
jgi:hypothetical protein